MLSNMDTNPTNATPKERLIHAQQVSSKYHVSDYLSLPLSDPSAAVRTWAEQVIWVRKQNISALYNHASIYGIDRSVVAVAANIIDRCLDSWVPRIRANEPMPYDLQVYCITAFYLATKSHVGKNVLPPIEAFLPYYSKDLLEDAEVDILYGLEWNIFYPTPKSIVGDLLSLLPAHWGFDPKDEALASYLRDVNREAENWIELVTLSYNCNTFPPVTIALAVTMSAIQNINRFLLLQYDPLQMFKDTVATHLGEFGISCDDPNVHECYTRISAILVCTHQEPEPWPVPPGTFAVPVTP